VGAGRRRSEGDWIVVVIEICIDRIWYYFQIVDIAHSPVTVLKNGINENLFSRKYPPSKQIAQA
jgi:hypothetical protein